jgi:hypothetical protein
MPSNRNRPEQDRLKLPASSWWIPSLTFFVALLAVVTAFA